MKANDMKRPAPGCTMKEMPKVKRVIEEDLTVTENGTVFSGTHFLGTVTVAAGVSGTVFKGCRMLALVNHGKDTAVLGCAFLSHSSVGIESDGDGLYVRNCHFEGGYTMIRATGTDIEIRECELSTGVGGTGIALSRACNSLVALCAAFGARLSVSLKDCRNTAVIGNSLVNLGAVGGEHIYAVDNTISDRLHAEGVDYLIADGNTYPEDGLDHTALQRDNRHTSGDTVTDVDARPAVGADERLTPHVDRDLFIGMERKRFVREYGREQARSLYTYLTEEGKGGGCVIVAPGAYAVEETARFTAEHSGLTVYAYGVLAEGVEYEDRSYNIPHILATDLAGLAVKGLSIGYAQQSNGQLHVLKKLGNNQVLAVTGAGMRHGFAGTGSPFFRNSLDFALCRMGSFASLGAYFSEKIEDNGDGSFTVTLREASYPYIQAGDVFTCRLGEYNHVVATKRSHDVLYKDFTQFGYAGGYAFFEDSNLDGTTYYRVADTYKSGAVIDKETYDRYRAWEEEYGVSLDVSVDEKGRYRGAPSYVSSLDATHCSYGARGSQVISSILENMCDDGTNQNSSHARLSEVQDNGDGTLTLVYKGNMTPRLLGAYGENATFSRFCAPFKKGDRVYIYTAGGQKICNTPVLADGEPYAPARSTFAGVKEQDITRFALRVKAEEVNLAPLASYDLTDDDPRESGKVLVDNFDAASYAFLFDNTVIRNGSVQAFRIRSSCGTVRNCTVENLAKSAVCIVLDLWWGESGVVEDFVFERNLIGRTGYCRHRAPTIEDPTNEIKYLPITIMGMPSEELDEEHLLLKNIRIEGNKFTDRCSALYDHAIYARAACHLVIRNNDFGDYREGEERTCRVLYLDGAADVELSGNTYPAAIRGKTEEYVQGTRYRHIHGTDVERNGTPLIPDKN